VSLTLTARSVAEVALPPSVLVRAGEQASMVVSLAAPASSITVVGLQSSAADVATVTPSVTFAVGDTTKPATVTGVSGGTAQVTALVSGIASATSTISVRGGVVTGAVGDPNPVAGAQVTIFHGGTPLTTVTDQSGAFDVEGVIGTGGAGRAFTVRATSGGLMGYTDALLSVRDGYAAVNVVLVPLSTIVGTVFRAGGTTPAGEGVRVDLYEAANSTTVVGTTFTDTAGHYEFRLLAPGTYSVKASDLSGNMGRATTTVGTSGQEVTANITFLGRGTVTGTVRDGAGNVVPFAQLELRTTSVFGSAPDRTGAASATGAFAFADVLIGSFSVTAYDPVTTRGGSSSGQIASEGQTVDVTVTLASYGNVEGTVFRSDGTTRAAGATVTVSCGGAVRSTTTDTNGRYAFTILPFAPFTITVRDAATRALGAASGSGFPTSGATVNADVVLQPQGAVLVTVLNAAGAPVNGASVTVTVSRTVNTVALTDTLSAATAPLNSVDGLALLSSLMAGNFTASASAGSLAGSGSGVVTEGGQTAITIQLAAPPPTGSITGTVWDQDGQSPASGSVRAVAIGAPYTTYSTALAGGNFTLSLVRLGTYRLEAYDTSNRLRAVATGVAITTDGQVETRSLVFIGLGRVLGSVTNPITGDASNVTVQVRSSIANFAGAWSATTGAAGEYTISGVPVGPITVAAWTADGLLRAEATRTLVQPGQDLTVDLVLENNTFTAPRTLYDANDSSYAMQPTGDRVAGGVRSILSSGAAWLDIVRDGTTSAFAGQSYGTFEDGGRETVARQNGLHGLNVTRKFFVPETGYFTRVLETLTNPTTTDITVDVRVRSNMTPVNNSAGDLVRQMTSSGNDTIEIDVGGVHDHWVVMDDNGNDVDAYSASGFAVPLAFVYDGPGAPRQVSAASAGANSMTFVWQSLTIPAGGTVTLMHFISQQVNRPAAIDSAGRIVQLPPEALLGLDADERASIANFVVPPGGVSTVDPLPALTGMVDGHVFEGDGLAPAAGATVYFRSLHSLFGRVWSTTADVSGWFSFAGAPRRPVPIAGTELRARHPVVTSTYSPTVLGELTEASPSLTQNLVFSGTGMLTGVVRRHTGAPVTSGSVTIARSGFTYATVAIAVDGRYVARGLPVSPDLCSLVANLPGHPQGTGLTSMPTTALIADGQLTTADIPIEPTGRLEGTLVDESGIPVANRQVDWYRLASGGGFAFRRVTMTDSAGRFISDDMPVGSYTARSYTPANGYPVTVGFAITQDAATAVTLSYQPPGTLTVTVLRASGGPAAGIYVRAYGNFSVNSVVTDVAGQAVFTGIPLNDLVTVEAVHSSQQIRTTGWTTLRESTGGAGALTVWLPAYGSLQGTVTLPNGSPLAGPNYGRVLLVEPNITRAVQTSYLLDGLPAGQVYTVRAYRYGDDAHYLDVKARIGADGDAVTVNTRVPALATVRLTVRQADSSGRREGHGGVRGRQGFGVGRVQPGFGRGCRDQPPGGLDRPRRFHPNGVPRSGRAVRGQIFLRPPGGEPVRLPPRESRPSLREGGCAGHVDFRTRGSPLNLDTHP